MVIKNCGRDRQTHAPRFGGLHKTQIWISEITWDYDFIDISIYIDEKSHNFFLVFKSSFNVNVQNTKGRTAEVIVVLVYRSTVVVFYVCTHYILQYIAMMNIIYTIQPFAMSNEQWIFKDEWNNQLWGLRLGHLWTRIIFRFLVYIIPNKVC